MSDDQQMLSDEEALREFLLDEARLEQLSAWDNKFNIFDVLKITRTEIRHSNVLAWLMDPSGNHGLGNRVIRGFVQYEAQWLNSRKASFEDLLMDCDGFTVVREWRGIDILAVNDAGSYVLCVENKVGAREHGAQLERYRSYVQEAYPGYKQHFVFLTPAGGDASDPAHWDPMGYDYVLNIINEALDSSSPPDDVRLLIGNYVDAVRRDVVNDEEISQICQAIYKKHKQALDLIFEHKPDRAANASAMFRSWVESRASEHGLVLNAKKSQKMNTRFTTKSLSAVFPDAEEKTSIWGTRNHYFYEIHLSDDATGYRIQLVFNSTGLSDEQREFCERVNATTYKAKITKENWTYRTHWTTNYRKLPDDLDEKTLFDALDKMLGRLEGFELDLKKQLGSM